MAAALGWTEYLQTATARLCAPGMIRRTRPDLGHVSLSWLAHLVACNQTLRSIRGRSRCQPSDVLRRRRGHEDNGDHGPSSR
jgi:hypothetical protein